MNKKLQDIDKPVVKLDNKMVLRCTNQIASKGGGGGGGREKKKKKKPGGTQSAGRVYTIRQA